jgi:hypothetical protein
MERSTRRSSRAPALRLLLVAAACLRTVAVCTTTPAYDATEITGFVYSQRDATPGQPLRPVADAAVSNDWDTSTVVTDRRGYFRMRMHPIASDEFVVITVQAGNVQRRSTVMGGARRGPLSVVLP